MTHAKKVILFDEQAHERFVKTLNDMVGDDRFHTEVSYSANTALYPDHVIPFIDKHVAYMRAHPTINPDHYLSNLRLMTRVRH